MKLLKRPNFGNNAESLGILLFACAIIQMKNKSEKYITVYGYFQNESKTTGNEYAQILRIWGFRLSLNNSEIPAFIFCSCNKNLWMIINVMLLGLDSQEEKTEKIVTCIHYISGFVMPNKQNLKES